MRQIRRMEACTNSYGSKIGLQDEREILRHCLEAKSIAHGTLTSKHAMTTGCFPKAQRTEEINPSHSSSTGSDDVHNASRDTPGLTGQPETALAVERWNGLRAGWLFFKQGSTCRAGLDDGTAMSRGTSVRSVPLPSPQSPCVQISDPMADTC
jgi:hypothetical protein